MERVTIAEGLSFSRFVAGMLHLPDFGDTDAARAHRIEELNFDSKRIIRPAYRNVGPEKKFIPMEKRGQAKA